MYILIRIFTNLLHQPLKWYDIWLMACLYLLHTSCRIVFDNSAYIKFWVQAQANQQTLLSSSYKAIIVGGVFDRVACGSTCNPLHNFEFHPYFITNSNSNQQNNEDFNART
jgi:hypothetical protein